MNKLVSTFIYYDKHEKNVLLCKFHSEYEMVDEFIGIESAYTLWGNYKGLSLESLLKDKEFKPFLDKITVLSSHESLYPQGVVHNEQNNLLCEFRLRGYCWDYIRNKYNDNDWIFLEDADEMLDFSNPKKRDILLDGFKKHTKGIQWQNLRWWWDFDNLNLNPDKYIPCHKIGQLKELERPFHNRNYFCTRLEPEIVCGVEFTYCFPRDGNWKKLTSGAHDKYREESLDKAYVYNMWHRESQRGESIQYPLDFFETMELTPENSTKFVMDNLERLKINAIDPNYAENRKTVFNCNPHPCLQHNLLRGNKIRNDRNYYKRNN
jgi:hypothetical protein